MLSEGKIDRKDYDKLKKSMSYGNSKKVMEQVQTKSGKFPVVEKLIDFVIENWDDILRLFMLFASLVADDRND